MVKFAVGMLFENASCALLLSDIIVIARMMIDERYLFPTRYSERIINVTSAVFKTFKTSVHGNIRLFWCHSVARNMQFFDSGTCQSLVAMRNVTRR